MKLLPKVKDRIEEIADDFDDVIIPYPSAGESKEVWKEICNKKMENRKRIKEILEKFVELIILEARKK